MFFFFNDTATTEIYTLSLHDALPIYQRGEPKATPLTTSKTTSASRPSPRSVAQAARGKTVSRVPIRWISRFARSEEHTSELQSRQYLVCRLLLEKKKTRECNENSSTH